MVLQIGADPGDVTHHRDAELLRQGSRPDPRQLQELRRAVDAAADDDLALCPRDMRHAITQKLDPARPAVLDEEARRVSLGADRQVRTTARRAQIGGRRAPAPPAVGGVLEGPGAFLLAVVEIVVGR